MSNRSSSRRWPRSKRTKRTSPTRSTFSCAVALVLAVAAHPESLSRTTIVVGPDALSVELRAQTLTLIETLPLDADGDGLLDSGELAAGSALLADYVRERLRLRPGRGATPMVLAGEAPPTLLAPDAFADPAWVRLRFSAALAGPLEELEVESFLFLESNPWHRDLVDVAWEGEAPHQRVLGDGRQGAVFRPAAERRGGVLSSFLRLGFQHVLAGWDHLAFLVALLVACAGWRGLVGVATAFTLAHSLTLGLAALGFVDPPARIVELAIALSIVYVAVLNVLASGPRTPWVEAFGFGLLHGLGFAGFLGDALAGEPLVTTALVGFNLGVEAGQLAFVLPAALLLHVVARPAADVDGVEGAERPGLVTPRLRRALSVLVAAAGLFWFTQRAGWI